MPRYPRQDDPKGKKVIPSVTEIISDCTDSSAPLMQWSANQVCEWIKENGRPTWDRVNGVMQKVLWEVDENQLNDARFNFRKVSQKALDIGSEVHNYIERYLMNGTACHISSKEAQQAILAFHEWENEHNLKPISLEQTVYGADWAGTLDFYGYFNDKLYVIDWKSSKAHYPEMKYQVAAYRWAKTEGSNIIPEAIQGCGILRLDKETGLPDWKDTSKTYEQDLSIFNAMADLYFKRHPRIAKKARG